MKKILSIIMICIVWCSCFVGCSNKKNLHTSKVIKTSKEKSSPKNTIEEYFQYWNDKNLNKIESMETERCKKQHKDFNLNNLKSIKVVSCKEWDVKENIKKVVYPKGWLKNFSRENVKHFTLELDINLKKNKSNNLKALRGIIILVRKDNKSNWLIQDVIFNYDNLFKNINNKI